MRDNVLEFVKGMPEVMAGNVLVAEGRTEPAAIAPTADGAGHEG